jgi:hypothetical protein
MRNKMEIFTIINRLKKSKSFIALGVTVNVILLILFVIGISTIHGVEIVCSPPTKYNDSTLAVIDMSCHSAPEEIIKYSNLGYEIKGIWDGLMYMQKGITK